MKRSRFNEDQVKAILKERQANMATAILCVLDDCTPEFRTLVADTSLSGAQVARELTSLMGSRGKPCRRSATTAPHRPHQPSRVGCRSAGSSALHRAGQADAEQLHRELARPPARRMPQRGAVDLNGPCPVRSRLAARLQHDQAALETGREDPAEIAGKSVWARAPPTRRHPIKHHHEGTRLYP